MSLLQVNNLCVDFIGENKDFTALKKVNLNLDKNEILGVVGESGSGKSTLIKSILRILSAPGLIQSGEIMFHNQNILKMKDQDILDLRWKKISLVKQKALNSLNPVKKIGDQLILPFIYHTELSKIEAKKEALKLLDLVKIEKKYFDSYPHELSGGMRQRIIIAIALALKPKIVIMDEPTTALDVITEREIIKNILELKKELKFSIIFITHDLNLLLQFADKLSILYNGKIVDEGTVNEIKKGGNHNYTTNLLKAIPNIQKVNKKNKNKNKCKIFSLNDINVVYELGSWLYPKPLKAVKNFSLNLYEKNITALIGESGSGKSTIAKVICGLENSFSGGLKQFFEVDEKSVYFNLDYRKKVQMIFQDPFSALNPIHTVYHHLSRSFIRFDICRNKNEIEKKAVEILETVDLKPGRQFLYKYPHEMSGGECQRVCIARSLIPKPKLIIADEPTSMLDVSIREEILKLFLTLKEKYSLSILFITHDIASASMIADRIVVLKNGKIVEKGSPKKIIELSEDNYTEKLIKASSLDWI